MINSKKVLVSVKNLTKKYGKFFALDNVSFDVYEGDKIALIGANGAGKSTLVDIIAGVRTKTSGEIKYNFENPKKYIALQLQDTSFPDGLKLIDIVNFYCGIFKMSPKGEHITKMLEFFQIKQFLNNWVSRLSGGQRQRVNAFLTIISNPKLLIVDEMATGLDITTKISLIEFINNYLVENKVTYITISHSEQEIIKTSNRVIILEEGKIVKDVATSEMGGEKGIYNYFLERGRK